VRAAPRGVGSPLRSVAAVLSVALAVALVAAGCTHRGAGGSSGSSSSPADPFGTIVVGPKDKLQLGMLLGLTGTDAGTGLAIRHGVQLALDYLDGTFDGTAGSLMDHQIDVTTADDGCTADGTSAGATQLASESGIVGVVGLSCVTSAIDGADQTLSEKGILLISPADTAPSLTADGTHQPFFLRTAYNEALDGVVMADFARGPANAETAAVVEDDTDASKALAEAFTGRFEVKGGTVTTSAAIGADGSGLAPVLQDMGKTPPAFAYVPGSDPSCASVVRQAQDVASLSSTSFGSSADCQGSFRATPVGSAGGSFLSTLDRSGVEGGEFYRLQFEPAYQSQFGTVSVPIVAAFAFDAANILFDAMQVSATKSDDGTLVFSRSALRDAIFATDSYEGLTGPLTCTPLGDCAAPVRFAVYPASDVSAGGTDPAVTPVFTEVLSSGDLSP